MCSAIFSLAVGSPAVFREIRTSLKTLPLQRVAMSNKSCNFAERTNALYFLVGENYFPGQRKLFSWSEKKFFPVREIYPTNKKEKKHNRQLMDIQQSRVRIKDIAEMAGVSVGTVDRVLHGRANVSKLSLEKVEKVLEEIKYEPNHYASALASNKTYKFAAIIPMHEEDSYWARVEKGLHEGVKRYTDFKLSFKVFYYDQFNEDSFEQQTRNLLAYKPTAVIIGPIFNNLLMTKFTKKLESRNLPYSLLDSYWPDFNPVSFYGQDAERSGAFSARVLLMAAAASKKIALFKMMGEGRVASRQQLGREKGFREYVAKHSPETRIIDHNLYVYDKVGVIDSLREFFTKHPDIEYGISFNSSIHVIGDFLKHEMPDHHHICLMGYDAIEANIRCLREGYVDFLIGQHPQQQGLNCFRSIVNSCVLQVKQTVVHYVGIDLLMTENIDFYKD